MAFEYDRGARRAPRRPLEGFSMGRAARVHTVPLSAASVLVVALVCAMSGLVMGLCLAMSSAPLLAFGFGAVLAGIAAWHARDALEK